MGTRDLGDSHRLTHIVSALVNKKKNSPVFSLRLKSQGNCDESILVATENLQVF